MQIGTHLIELGESYLMSTNMIRLRRFTNILSQCALEESSLNIGRVNKDKVMLCSSQMQPDNFVEIFKEKQSLESYQQLNSK